MALSVHMLSCSNDLCSDLVDGLPIIFRVAAFLNNSTDLEVNCCFSLCLRLSLSI